MSSTPLRVSTEDRRHFILVPSRQAQALRSYLSRNGVTSSPPEPSSGGSDSIELNRKADVVVVQVLLDRWKSAP
jgi:hypothetical protein